MNDSNEQVPQWVLSSRSDLEKAKRDWIIIRQAGQADIKRGLESIKVADQRLEELNYLEQTLGQNLPYSMWNDEIVHVTGTYLGGAINAFERDSNHIAGLYTDLDQYKQTHHEYLILAVNGTAVSTGSMIYMNAGIERRFIALTPTYKPLLETIQPIQIGSRQHVYDQLAIILKPLDPKYLNMLIGSEDALHTEGTDHLSQAAHSMRDLFQKVIEHLAPTELVKLQPWFTPTPEVRSGVSRKSRLRYLMYGTGNEFDKREIEQLDETAERAKVALDLVISRAHDHDPQLTYPEVELSIDHARFSLLAVLNQYATRRN